MAIGRATCICKKCGAEFERTCKCYNRRDADQWEQYAMNTYDTCPKCEQLEKEARAEECMAAQKEDGLPELRGTDKQKQWAYTLRQDMVVRIEKALRVFENETQKNPTEENREAMELLHATAHYIMSSCTWASWWIDNRHVDGEKLLLNTFEKNENRVRGIRIEKNAQPDEQAMAAQALAEMMFAPAEPISGDVSEIIINADENGTTGEILLRYVKDETFRSVVRGKFNWDADRRCWRRKITTRSGPIRDRATEIGLKLLEANIRISVQDEETRRKITAQEFAPECDRWVTCGDGKTLNLEYPYDAKLVALVKTIPGCRWDAKERCMTVPVKQADKVIDFATLYGFRITDKAQAAIDAYKSALVAAKVITPTILKEEKEKEDALSKILESGDEVLDDLRDE